MNNQPLRILCSIFALVLLFNCPVESRKGSSSSSSGSRGVSSSRSGISSGSSSSSSSGSRIQSSSSNIVSSGNRGSSSSSNSNDRGSSSSRGFVASSANNAGGSSSAGVNPGVVSSGFSSNSNQRPAPVAVSSSGFGGGTSSFTKGSGSGSFLQSSNLKAAIAGAAAGYITYKAGKAIIKSVSRPMYWGGRNYYWSSNYYQRQTGYEMCMMSIENDAYFGNFAFDDGSRPRQMVWSCRSTYETCCGYDCCQWNSNTASGNGIEVFSGSTNLTGNINTSEPALSTSSSFLTNITAITDCYDIKRQNPVAADGVYAVELQNASLPFDVYCDMSTENGGWTVFQRRMEGSQDFSSQDWTSYVNGFGNVQDEHWLGLEKLFRLIEKEAGSPVQMRVEMTDCNDHTIFETYANFRIGGADTKYALLSASGANGTAGDAFSANPPQIGSIFSTEDSTGSSPMPSSLACASKLKGGWWYSSCGNAHLNSVYYPQCNYTTLNQDGITWATGFSQNGGMYSPIMTKMMIRRSGF